MASDIEMEPDDPVDGLEKELRKGLALSEPKSLAGLKEFWKGECVGEERAGTARRE